MARDRHRYRVGLSMMAVASAAAAVTLAQQDPVATMFRAELKRDHTLAASFQPTELPATAAAPASNVYLIAGDLERAFDTPEFRPDGAIVPTNTALVVTAASPTIQRVLIARVMRSAAVMADLQDQIAERRKQSPAAAGDAVLQMGVDAFLAGLPRTGAAAAKSAFPRHVCMVATDFAAGGAIDRRELLSQDRLRKGIAACLAGLDAAGARSVVIPMLGAASAETQSKDAVFEGQRLLKECRHLNSVAGIALGIHDFAADRRAMREIGIVQWDREITDMFGRSAVAQAAYRLYAEQIKAAFSRGLAGQRTTAAEVDGNCAATFGAA